MGLAFRRPEMAKFLHPRPYEILAWQAPYLRRHGLSLFHGSPPELIWKLQPSDFQFAGPWPAIGETPPNIPSPPQGAGPVWCSPSGPQDHVAALRSVPYPVSPEFPPFPNAATTFAPTSWSVEIPVLRGPDATGLDLRVLLTDRGLEVQCPLDAAPGQWAMCRVPLPALPEAMFEVQALDEGKGAETWLCLGMPTIRENITQQP